MKRFQHTFLALMRFLAFALCFVSFFGLFGILFPFLLRPSRTSVIMSITFFVVYVLTTLVYGGLDIGRKKSKPIVFSYVIKLLVTDFFTHLFLCVMNTTVLHGGKFVYEAPWLLACVYAVQIGLICLLTYVGNGIFFHFNAPAKCLVIKRAYDSADTLTRRVAKLKRQYRVACICDNTAHDVLSRIDEADAVFLYNLGAAERTPLVEYCFQQRKEIYYNMELQDIVALGSEQMIFDDKPMVHYRVKGLTFEQRIFKRAMDIAVSGLGLLIASPIMLITALAIKLEDHGKVFYEQPRLTYGGREFNVLKFRSMREDAGKIHRSVQTDDDRITKVGRVIRKFRIDELPQLINILKSDMSLVGPRPEMVENMRKYTQDLPEFAYRLRAKAGLTGMAQIYGKYNTSPADKLAMDLTYIEHYSVWLDIKLLLRTVLVLLTPDDSTEAFEQDASDGKEEQKV